jgi:hypothetical protein
VSKGVLVRAGWQTMVYAKPCEGDKERNRIDFGAFNEIGIGLQKVLLTKLEEAIAISDAI